MPDPVLIFAVAAAVCGLAGYVFGVATAAPCVCKDCALHRQRDKERAEVKRAAEHRKFHSYWRVAWGEDHCTACRNGGVYDRDRR